MSANASPAPHRAADAFRATGRERLEGLDGLRGIAALSVLGYHAVGLLHPEWNLIGRGYLAVDFFFMLSGYVMARTYEQRLAQGFGTRRFMVARYRKLWPFMAVGALLGTPIVAFQLGDPLATLKIAAPNILLIPSFGEGALYPVNIAAWSIAAELFANLLHGLILWRMPSRMLALLCLCLVPLVCWIAASFGGLTVGADTASTHLGFARALLPYCIGIMLWRWWRDRPTLPVNPGLAFAAMPPLVLLVPALLAVPWAYDIAFSLLVCPLLMAGGLAWRGSSATLRWIGLISFPLYAVNLPILLWSKALGLGMLSGLALCLGLAWYLAMQTGAQAAARPLAAHG